MRGARITLFAATFALFAPAVAHANDRGNAAHGAALAGPCAACHGGEGQGGAAAGVPRLAGLDAGYLEHQLDAFATPARKNPIMSPIAAGLPAAERRDLAAYYASLRPKPLGAPADPQAVAGAVLAERGDWGKGVPPCASCHGRDGLGVGSAFPPLAGQPARYLANALRSWVDGGRGDDPQGLMGGIARKLAPDQVATVAAYYASLSPVPGQLPQPVRDTALPDDELGKVARQGEAIFRDPKAHAARFVGNSLTCANCHLDAGRRADSAPMGAAYLLYPAYRKKTHHVDTFAERLQGCFRYSMNGTEPLLGDEVLVALETYAFVLAKGQPVGSEVPGQGYPKLPPPAQAADFSRGAAVFAGKCAICHGSDGAGQKSAAGAPVFPALWGADSYNWGAGMESIANASGFIKANMPLGQGGTLSDQEAWDVALFMDSHERPQDPRFTGDVAATRQRFHDTPMSMYGRTVAGKVLGAPSR